MAEKIKINDTTVAEIGMVETRRVFSKTQLIQKKELLEAQLVEVNEFLTLFD